MPILYRLHKYLSIPMSILFLCWFVSGLVMIYHRYPRLDDNTRPMVKVDHEQIAQLWKELPDSFSSCQILVSGAHTLIKTDDEMVGRYTPAMPDLRRIAGDFGSSITRVDTLTDVDQWIPFNRLMKEMPIYRIVTDSGQYIYVSSRTGEILQYNWKAGRRWACIGAVPHYIYYTPLRRNVDLWRDVVCWLAGICIASVVFGLVIAVRFVIRNRSLSIFRRRLWQYHLMLGLLFGIFMCTFAFSGMMSLAKVPEFIAPRIPLQKTMLLKDNYSPYALPDSMKRCVLTDNSQPAFEIIAADGKPVSVSAKEGGRLDFSIAFMEKAIAVRLGTKVLSTTPVTNDLYYYQDGLPGYKTETADRTVYWNNHGYFRVMDSNSKARRICYQMLHALRMPFFNSHESLRQISLWILMLGGIAVTVSGCVISLKAVKHRK